MGELLAIAALDPIQKLRFKIALIQKCYNNNDGFDIDICLSNDSSTQFVALFVLESIQWLLIPYGDIITNQSVTGLIYCLCLDITIAYNVY